MSGRSRSNTTQSNAAFVEQLEAPLAASTAVDLHVAARRAAREHARARSASGSTTSKLLRTADRRNRLNVGRTVRRAISLVWIGLGSDADRADAAAPAACSSSVETTYTGMCRVSKSCFRRSSTRQPSMSGRQMSSVIGSGSVLARQRQAAAPRDVAMPLKPFSWADVEQQLRERRIVLDDQHDAVAGLNRVAVVVEFVGGAPAPSRQSAMRLGRIGLLGAAARVSAAATGRRSGLRRGVGLRQVERERAAAPGVLTSRISPPSSRAISRLIARPRPVPPYLRLVLPSACWNASKMICCLSGGMPMPVSVTENATTASAAFSDSLSRLQPSRPVDIAATPCRGA